MPTGYTAAVADGTVEDLPTFAMQLARGMGALVTMRDEPWNAPIPERLEPSVWNAKRLAETQAERDRVLALSTTDAAAEAEADWQAFIKAKAEVQLEHSARRRRYDQMIEKVEAWQGAPEGIREFALEQLTSGRDFDCRESFIYYREAPPRDGEAWRTARLAKLQADIEYHSLDDAKERARTDGRNAWLTQLRRSLEPAASDADA